MAKKDKQPQPLYSDELNEEIKELMGPPPEEAEANVPHVEITSENPKVPSGPPLVAKRGREYLGTVPPISPNHKSTNSLNEETEKDEKKPDTNEDANSEPQDAPVVAVSETAKVTDERPATNNVSDVAKQVNEQILADQAKTAQQTLKPLKIIDNTAPKSTESLDDPTTEKAVNDIIAKESDELLAVEDAVRNANNPAISTKKPKKNFIAAWWHNKRLRYITLAGLLAIFVAILAIPYTRYTVLNTVGVRSAVNLKVIDAKYGLPIKNVEVSAGGQTAISDAEGVVQLNNVRLGKTELVLNKRSFATKSQPIVVGWGSNPFNDPIQLDATGSAYSFTVTDWSNGKPLAKAEVSDGESKVLTDDNGKVSMLLQSNDKDINFIIKADGYRQENLVISSNDKAEKSVQLVVANPDIFVSKRSGKYDVYKKDVDGKNEVALLGGTGSEQETMSLLPNQPGSVAAVASTRDGKRDKDGYLLSNLYIIDVATRAVSKVTDTESAQIQLIDWVGDKLIFVKVAAGPSAATSSRQKIISYDYKQDKSVVLASANYFNDVEVYKNQVYYATNSSGGVAQLIRINPDNSSKVTLLSQEVWQLLRPKNDRLVVNAADKKWYEQQVGDAKLNEMLNPPANTQNRLYIDSPNGQKTVWVDERDGKGVLILEDTKTSEAKTLLSKGGLNYPIRWLSDKYLLVRVSNSQETADYVLNIESGEPKKVSDVTNTAQTNRWYYYR